MKRLSPAAWSFAALWIIGLSAVHALDPVQQPPSAAGNESDEQIQSRAIRAHLEFLADDLLEGRGVGTRGHKLAVNYIRSQCDIAGLHGGAENGGYFQIVPLVRTSVEPKQTSLELKGKNGTQTLECNKDFALLDTHRDTEGSVSADLVFAGYGVSAPEQGYDDYAGLDVKGKIAVMLAFEAPPAFPSAIRAYYADHEFKRSNAAAHGAVGVLYIRSPATETRFPWAMMMQELRIGGGSLRWLQPSGRPKGLDDTLSAFGMLNRSGAEALFADEKHPLAEIFAGAETGTLPRFAMSKRAAIKFQARHEKVESENVVAVLDGSDPVLKTQYVLYSAHVDHLGIGTPVDGDSIYNGAVDNASGCAVQLEVARAMAAATPRPKRSIVFLFVTAEEAGLIGSDYFACHPTIPKEQIVADINLDAAVSMFPVSDVIARGAEYSSLGAVVQSAASQTGFTVSSDPFAEEGVFVRNDEFPFVKQGIPSVYVALGMTSTEPGVDGLARFKQWMVTTYHSPKDDLSQPIQYETSARFARFVFRLGRSIAMDAERPRWNPNDFFGDRFGSGGR